MLIAHRVVFGLESQKELAKEFRVSAALISSII
jgi:hypothetical protein